MCWIFYPGVRALRPFVPRPFWASYAWSSSSSDGGGEAGPVVGAGGEADEVEPAQVVVQIAGGDAAAGAQSPSTYCGGCSPSAHADPAPNPFPHRAVECFVAHPDRRGGRKVGSSRRGRRPAGRPSRRHRRSRARAAASTLGSTCADRRPAPVRRHEPGTVPSRERPRFFALPPRRRALRPSPRGTLPALQDVGLVRFHDPLEHLRTAPRRRQKPVTPAERRAHRHVAARRRGLHRLPLRQRRRTTASVPCGASPTAAYRSAR